MIHKRAYLIVKDGSVFQGISFGAPPLKPSDLKRSSTFKKSVGEVVFNTGMTGYHEILTDPSYTGQIVTMTCPHIGNYGCHKGWSEVGPEEEGRNKIKSSGIVVRSVYGGAVPAGRETLDAFLRQNDIPGLSEVDTRSLTIKLRDSGSQTGIIVRSENARELTPDDKKVVMDFLLEFPEMEGRNLLSDVGTLTPVTENPGGSPRIGLIDYGIKANIIKNLVASGCRVDLFPGNVTFEEIKKINPDGIFFSNGPGDPGVLLDQIDFIKKVIGNYPIAGICLGHQLISLALGAKTFKLKFGHHGNNHPVRDEKTGKVFVTSQNHGFSVDEDSLPGDVEVWFRNANDNTIEGIHHKKLRILTVQFHPEAAPGPRDSLWIFRDFVKSFQRNIK